MSEIGPEALTQSARPRKAREIAAGIHFLAGFGNTTFLVGREAVAVVDPGLFSSGPRVVAELRAITDLPVRYVIYTHGHYDHAWVWVPEARVVVGGDFIVSSLPNAGTPFRVQRYVLEWAESLEAMAAVEPVAVVSGHGGVFTEDATEMLQTTARGLRWLDAEVVRRINAGQWQEQILAEVELPADLAGSRFLQPLYGCTAFAVRDLLRRYMGWYDGNPSMLFPSSRAAIAHEVLALAGGADAILRRADELAAGDAAEQQRALHLVDFVIFGGGEQVAEARRRKAELLDARSAGERSFVASNVLNSAAVLEREAVGKD